MFDPFSTTGLLLQFCTALVVVLSMRTKSSFSLSQPCMLNIFGLFFARTKKRDGVKRNRNLQKCDGGSVLHGGEDDNWTAIN